MGYADKAHYDEDTGKYTTRARQWACRYNNFFRLDFNPVVTFISALIIWGLVIWCVIEPDDVGITSYRPIIY